jgi:hypothetical protein
VAEQLSFQLETPAPNANAGWFKPDGTPRRLLWCSDDPEVRSGVKPCPYEGRRVPCGECCHDVLLDGPNPLTTLPNPGGIAGGVLDGSYDSGMGV